MNGPQIPENVMVCAEGNDRACFVVNERLEVTMSNGEGVAFSIRLTPAEARGFAHVFAELADLAEENGEICLSDCVGSA